ncbi:hypothetical protein LIER_41756 [Lithospermum erythrorhizon]|uniref:RNase H type-1 domain-containing protein n=1 Tax=Lithospermum erythrorhizon TaxID=34254 RepID=A0AAV3RJZ9_LITER
MSEYCFHGIVQRINHCPFWYDAVQALEGGPQGGCLVQYSSSQTAAKETDEIVDAQGCIVMVVAFCLPASSALDAELLAAYHILKWCVIRGFTDLRVETDSLLLSQMLRIQKAHWLRHNMVVQVISLLQVCRSELTHVWREQNQAADWVAKVALSERRSFSWRSHEVDGKLRSLCALESRGVPYVRR